MMTRPDAIGQAMGIVVRLLISINADPFARRWWQSVTEMECDRLGGHIEEVWLIILIW